MGASDEFVAGKLYRGQEKRILYFVSRVRVLDFDRKSTEEVTNQKRLHLQIITWKETELGGRS